MFIAIRARGRREARLTVPLSLALAVVFGVITGGLAWDSYQEYVIQNTWRYDYVLHVYPNATSQQAVIVPIPQDTSIIPNLHLISGEANWSFTDTIHGRGLYVQFSGPTSLESSFSEYPRSGSNERATPTMTNNSGYWGPVWIYYAGSGGVSLTMFFWATITRKALVAGWNLYLSILSSS